MGEAKRRREAYANAYAEGGLFPRPSRCPACRSPRIVVEPGPALWREHANTEEIGICLECQAVWEPFPSLYVPEPVCAEPCDNCAFRPGSPEQLDKQKWRELLDSLKPSPDDPWTSGRFYCHKNVPVDMTAGPGNFLFPKLTQDIGDVAPGKTVTLWDTSKMRICSGFLRMVWSITGVKARHP